MDGPPTAVHAPPAVIVEALSALSPLGLLTAMSLAQHTAVWLPRALWTLLDNDGLYRACPEALGGSWLPSEERAARVRAAAEALPLWRRAWYLGHLSQAVNVVPEAPYEALSPKAAGHGLIDRFERCARALPLPPQREASGPLDDCARDAAALAAALQPAAALILVTAPTAGGEPDYCAYLRGRGIAVTASLGGEVLPALSVALRSGASEAGAPLAAIALLAPGAFGIASLWSEDAEAEGEEDEDDRLWDGARAVWFRMEVAA